MSKKMPLDIKKLMDAVTSLGEAREYDVYVDLVFDPTASDRLINVILAAFESTSKFAHVRSLILENEVPSLPMPADLCVVVGGDSLLLGDVAHAARAMGTPTVVAVCGDETFFTEEVPEPAVKNEGEGETALALYEEHWGVPVDDVIDVDFGGDVKPLEVLGTWIVNKAPAKRLAMAECFSFLRSALCNELVQATALQNTAVGFVFFMPGADMPAITLNQAKMVLQIASVYEQPLDAGRVKEIAAVVAGAFGLRALAREVAGLVPGLGWTVKGAIAYGGTVAIGRAAVEYFDEGGAIAGLAQTVKDAVERFIEEAAEGEAAAEEGPAEKPKEAQE